jgi:hypothetical protein
MEAIPAVLTKSLLIICKYYLIGKLKNHLIKNAAVK